MDHSDNRAPRALDEQATRFDDAEAGPESTSLRAAPAAGDRIGAYVVESVIGHGGMGIVVAAHHATRGERVAVKLLRPKAQKDAVQVERFVREARATARIDSEHVVRVLDAGAEETTGAPFIVMERLEGRDIGYVLSHFGPMPIQTAVDYIIQICAAVAAAHAQGIIHRDLKPSNFFLTQRPDGSPLVKVLDFGISKAIQNEGAPDPRLTETQAVFGSPTYMSPEQIRSSKNVDERSDMWSVGVALFEMLTGKLPFVSDNVAGLLASVIADLPLRVAVFTPECPPDVEAIVLACLEKDASRRIGSAAELAARLAPFASPAGAQLATRVAQGARRSGSSQSLPPAPPHGPGGSHPSFPPLPRLPSLSSPEVTAQLAPNGSFRPAPSAPYGYGITGTDLSSTGPAAFRNGVRRGSGRLVALVVGAVVLLAVAFGVIVLARDARRARSAALGTDDASAAPPPSVSATAMPAATAATAATASAAPTAEPSDSAAPPASAAPGARPHRPHARPHGSAGVAAAPGAGPAPSAAPAPAPASPPVPVAPSSPNLDSRF